MLLGVNVAFSNPATPIMIKALKKREYALLQGFFIA